MKRMIFSLLILAFALSLCSCGQEREEGTIGPAVDGTELPVTDADLEPFSWSEELTSTNGDVKVSIHVEDCGMLPETMPVIAVNPMPVTSDMLRQASSAIFGDAPLYEDGWMLTRAELEQIIASSEQGVLIDRIREDYEDTLSEQDIEEIRARRQAQLDHWREALANSADELVPIYSDYLFRPCEYWSIFSHDYYEDYPTYSGDPPFGIQADFRAYAETNGRLYHIWASNLTRDGFWNHSLTVFLDEPQGGIAADKAYISSAHLADDSATDNELRQAAERAEALLLNMGFGTWRCEVEIREFYTEPHTYGIRVNGWKEREGWSQQVRGGLASQSGGGYYEHFCMDCANDGTLIKLELRGLLEEESFKTTPLISWEEAMNAARAAMNSWTLADQVHGLAFGIAQPSGLTREITEITVGHFRKPTGQFTYELIPVLCLRGTEYLEGVPDSMNELNEYGRVFDFLVIDLRDGSVINGSLY